MTIEFNEVQQLIADTCDGIKELLLEKNRKYGNSALYPQRIFARSDAIEQIKVRIDDKLNRIRNAQADEDEDVEQDLMGYLVLLRVAKQLQDSSKQEPGQIVLEFPKIDFATGGFVSSAPSSSKLPGKPIYRGL